MQLRSLPHGASPLKTINGRRIRHRQIKLENAGTEIAPVRRMRPILCFAHEAMLHRIGIAIGDVIVKILIVADQMLPKSPLPDAALAAAHANSAPPLCSLKESREAALDQTPSKREIRVTLGQRENSMQMIGQYHQGIDAEWLAAFGPADGGLKFTRVRGEQRCAPLKQVDGEKIRSARNENSAIVRHKTDYNKSQKKRRTSCGARCGAGGNSNARLHELGPLVLQLFLARRVPWERGRLGRNMSGGRLGPFTRVSKSSLLFFICDEVMWLNLTWKERVTSRPCPTTGGCTGNFNAIIDCSILVNVSLRSRCLGKLFSGKGPIGHLQA